MAILPSRNNFNQPASAVLLELKKGDKEPRNNFVWAHQERFYAIAYMATGQPETATELTIMAFQNVFATLRQTNPKQVNMPLWYWLSQFIVDACAEYHQQFSGSPPPAQRIDPAADGSNQMDWETTVILGTQRVRRCLSSLSEEQQKVFILRHQLDLTYEQMAAVLNQSKETIQAWLYRARVQIVKCLGRG
ncbi:MAG TPA: sigma-70 family RNA polymerase sigma factor [Candidatus Obscuribacterales bacterium]